MALDSATFLTDMGFQVIQGYKQGFYYRIKSIFVLPIVSDWTNVFIVTWLSYAEEEITFHLH